MSLIFQSLQKLDTDLEEHTPGDATSAPHPDGTSSGTRRLGLRPVIIGAVLILGVGFGAVYAVQYLKDRTMAERDAMTRRQSHKVPVLMSASTVADAPPAEPEAAPLSKPVEVQASPETQTRFYPPEESAAEEQPPAPKATPPVQSTPVAVALERVREEVSMDAAADPPVPEEVPADAPAAPKTAVDAQIEAAVQARRTALEKSARIGRLVRQIEQALAAGGNPRESLDQLARIKGRQHPYVAKLRAYWNFRQGRYDLAQADLQRVLTAHPDDLEAGINMALIEIRRQRYPEALARLKQLRDRYPENERVADLISRLR